ncbi:MAG: hypothetical protein RR983_14375, partial [Massilia sp.]
MHAEYVNSVATAQRHVQEKDQLWRVRDARARHQRRQAGLAGVSGRDHRRGGDLIVSKESELE